MDEYQSLTTNGGSASTTLFLYANANESCCTGNAQAFGRVFRKFAEQEGKPH
jgi:hypothetical protein